MVDNYDVDALSLYRNTIKIIKVHLYSVCIEEFTCATLSEHVYSYV